MVRIRRMGPLAGAALLMALAAAPVAQAAPAKAKKPIHAQRAQAKVVRKPVAHADARAIGELMGEFKFGMSPKDVMEVIGKKIDEKYAEQIATTNDVYAQDKLREAARKERARLAKSYVTFKGVKTGWDVSIIDVEFAHNDDESMLLHWERDPATGKDQRRFFFFVDEKLYKMFVAFNATMFGDDKDFSYFQQAMEKRYGKGELVQEKDKLGNMQVSHLYWHDDKYDLRAINQLDFYGAFCLAISDAQVEKWLGKRRAERSPAQAEDNKIIESVTEGDDDKPPSLDDTNSNAVDSVIKKPKPKSN